MQNHALVVPAVRLTQPQLSAVRQCLRNDLGEGARAWLFGSRLDLQRRGGDVDLYVETSGPLSVREEMLCKMHLKQVLDLPVDLIVAPIGSPTPIGAIAKNDGMELL